jgi:hypothetical protein
MMGIRESDDLEILLAGARHDGSLQAELVDLAQLKAEFAQSHHPPPYSDTPP